MNADERRQSEVTLEEYLESAKREYYEAIKDWAAWKEYMESHSRDNHLAEQKAASSGHDDF